MRLFFFQNKYKACLGVPIIKRFKNVQGNSWWEIFREKFLGKILRGEILRENSILTSGHVAEKNTIKRVTLY